MFDIKENLKKLPDLPGVYMHKDSLGQVIYVGKAVSLKSRVRQYFQSYGKSTPKLRALTDQIAEFEYITCGSEMEALILECNLIKKYQPKYNVLLRDDKTYPYIMVTTSEKYPRVIKTRIIKKDGNKYFGPYSDVGAVNLIVDQLNETFGLKRCSAEDFPKGFRPCLNYHIEQCQGICQGDVDEKAYGEKIESILAFLSGRDKAFIRELKDEMEKASSEMRFEDAARARDLIMSAEALAQAQRVTMVSGRDMDVVIPVKDDENSFVVLFTVRDGKLVGRETFDIASLDGDEAKLLTAEFLKQYYEKWSDVPHDILVPELPDDAALIEEFLGRNKHKVKLSVPRKGERLAIMKLAKKDTLELLNIIKDRQKSSKEKSASLKKEIDIILEAAREAMHLSTDINGKAQKSQVRSYRVESYDISNTNGVDSVGAMVVFEGASKIRKDYRRFKIKTVEGPDDYASLREMVYRRFIRANQGDPAFKILPDIIFMDGGLGQVTSALKAMDDAGVKIPVVGLAKDDSHRTRAIVFADGSELDLKEHPLLFKYAGTIQEEVHRFAIEYHRNLHGKRAITSVLDEIEGIGPTRRNALLAHFGSIDAIKKASIDELASVPGMNHGAAEKVREFFSK
ncbi:MAG: excinuclease ABC subunit UvrC [Firmicutes bacterium]|nr:excinuclease ABC subunit UvrC [Bacillota bacterium]